MQPKVRCVFCGAKNTDPHNPRCRICGGMLPDAAERQRERPDDGQSFKTIVEAEVGTWQQYERGSLGSTAKSRRPSELPPVDAWTAAPGQERADTSTPPDTNGRDTNGPGETGTRAAASPDRGRRRLFRR